MAPAIFAELMRRYGNKVPTNPNPSRAISTGDPTQIAPLPNVFGGSQVPNQMLGSLALPNTATPVHPLIAAFNEAQRKQAQAEAIGDPQRRPMFNKGDATVGGVALLLKLLGVIGDRDLEGFATGYIGSRGQAREEAYADDVSRVERERVGLTNEANNLVTRTKFEYDIKSQEDAAERERARFEQGLEESAADRASREKIAGLKANEKELSEWWKTVRDPKANPTARYAAAVRLQANGEVIDPDEVLKLSTGQRLEDERANDLAATRPYRLSNLELKNVGQKKTNDLIAQRVLTEFENTKLKKAQAGLVEANTDKAEAETQRIKTITEQLPEELAIKRGRLEALLMNTESLVKYRNDSTAIRSRGQEISMVLGQLDDARQIVASLGAHENALRARKKELLVELGYAETDEEKKVIQDELKAIEKPLASASTDYSDSKKRLDTATSALKDSRLVKVLDKRYPDQKADETPTEYLNRMFKSAMATPGLTQAQKKQITDRYRQQLSELNKR